MAPSNLQFGDMVLLSMCGVQQGDPLGPFLFCLAIHPLLCKIKQECPNLAANAWYLDDGVIAGPEAEVLRALEIIETEAPARGFNAGKSEVIQKASSLTDCGISRLLMRMGLICLVRPLGRRPTARSFLHRRCESSVRCGRQSKSLITCKRRLFCFGTAPHFVRWYICFERCLSS
jgi:hypothetical protein